MKPINLFGLGLHASSFAIAAESRLNCYYEIRKDPDGAKIVVRGTPGSYVMYTLPTGPVRGWQVVGNVLYVAAAGFLFSVTSAGAIAKVANLPTSTGPVSMSDNYIQLILVDGTGGYVFTIGTATFTTITDVNFPNGATTVTFLSGKFLVEKPTTREVYASATLDGLSWTSGGASIFATKEQYSDLLTAVDAFNGVLILWGTDSIEYWQDVGATPFPFQKIGGTTQTYGLIAKYSRAVVNNALLFLGAGIQSGLKVFSTTGYQPTPVSTPDVDDFISGLAVNYTISDAVAMTYSINGHDMYQLTFPSANRTLIYDTQTQLWGFAQTGVPVGRHYANYGAKFLSHNIFSDTTSANIYMMSPVSYADTNYTIVRQVVSKHLRNGGEEFAITELELIMDTGAVTQAADYHISMEVSRDGGRTYGSPRPRTLGKVGQYYTPRVKWDRMGSSNDFVLRFTMTDPVNFVIAGTEIETSASK